MKSSRIHKGRRYCLALIVLCTYALTAACGHVPDKTSQQPAGWALQQASNSAIDSWYVEGRLGVQTRLQGGSLDVFWNQQGEHYQIRLIAPMGQGAFFINGDAHSVTLTNADGTTHTSDSADDLFSQSLGVKLPLASLRHWLRGLPDAGSHELQWDELGRLNIVEQLGWRVEMTRYRATAEHTLPHAFYLSRADQPELMVRLLLRNWQLEDLPALESQP